VSDAALIGAVAWLIVLGGLAAGRPHTDRVRWAAPPLLRAAEYGVVAAASWSGAGVDAACYGYLLAVIWHHYDSAYRLRRGMPGAATSPMTRFAGFELRTVALVALAGAGAGAFRAAEAALAGVIVVLAVVQTWSMWRHSQLVSASTEGDGDRR
jgi:hypothetical protein